MINGAALLLDFGGVITRTLFECVGDVERHFGVPRGGLPWRGPLDPASDELWRAILGGTISERDYWRHRIAALGETVGRSLDFSDVIAAACGVDPDRVVRPEARALVRKAKTAGCRTGVLSNDLERLYGRDAIARIDILREVDCIVDGSWSRVHKPSPQAYARALAALGTSAEETVFVDDQPRNVEGATIAGMTGVVFDICSPASSFRMAERLLGFSG